MTADGLQGKRILVIGACGTIGRELVHQLLDNDSYAPAEVTAIDHHENALFFLDQQYLGDPRAFFFVADVRDRDEVSRRMRGIDVVFHTAALKHVILSERSPDQALATNILGVQNVIAAATDNGVETLIFTSTDKAVNPTNVMGTSKLMGERLVTAANSNKRSGPGTVFASTRFGNVLGSSGSVIQVFHNQIASGGPVTLTDARMSRFIMSVAESVRLVIDSAELARGGEVFITKMPVIRIEDLAQAMITELAPRYGYTEKDIKLSTIGTKPGEKLYEELMSQEETRRTVELERYFSVLPAFRGIYRDIDYDYPTMMATEVAEPYISDQQQPLDIDGIRAILRDEHLFGAPEASMARRYWPGDKEQHR